MKLETELFGQLSVAVPSGVVAFSLGAWVVLMALFVYSMNCESEQNRSTGRTPCVVLVAWQHGCRWAFPLTWLLARGRMLVAPALTI